MRYIRYPIPPFSVEMEIGLDFADFVDRQENMDGVWNISWDFYSCYYRFNQISSNWLLYNSHWSHLWKNAFLRAFLFYLYIHLCILFYLYPPTQCGNCSFNFPTAWEHQGTESSALSQQEELGSTKHLQKPKLGKLRLSFAPKKPHRTFCEDPDFSFLPLLIFVLHWSLSCRVFCPFSSPSRSQVCDHTISPAAHTIATDGAQKSRVCSCAGKRNENTWH